ncbi:MAG: hypothetical protein QX198_09170, partial [Methylococcaceae bacterium]
MKYRIGNSDAGDSWPGWRNIWADVRLTNLNQLTNGPGYITGAGNAASDPTFNSVYFANTSLRLYKNSAQNLHIVTPYGYLNVGPENSSWCHYQTDATEGHYFYQKMYVNGTITAYGGFIGNINGSSGSCTGNAASASLVSGSGVSTVGALKFSGEGGNSGQAYQSYGIYQETGAWAHPYPDLIIGFHTGIKIGAEKAYGGTRFYNNCPYATGNVELFSVGNGDDHVRVANTIYAASLSGPLAGNATTATDASNVTTTIQGTRAGLYNRGEPYGAPGVNPTYDTGSLGRDVKNMNQTFEIGRSGFLDVWGAADATGMPPGCSHVQGFQSLHYAYGYGLQIVGQHNQDIIYVRQMSATTYRSWRKIWDSATLTNLNQLTNGPGYITSSGTSAACSGNAATASSSVNFMSTSHAGSYWLVNNWTGAHWHITSNHGAGVRVAYADTAGSAPASDVYSWAKASTKPTYTAAEVGAGASQ